MALHRLPAGRARDITFYQDLAQQAEAAKPDEVFFALGPALDS